MPKKIPHRCTAARLMAALIAFVLLSCCAALIGLPSEASQGDERKPASPRAASSEKMASSAQSERGVGKRASVNKAAKAKKKSSRKFDGSFINGKMVLSKYVRKNGFHKGKPVVVIVDKGSHFTYVLQKQAKNRVFLVYRASNAIGTNETPTPPGPYRVVSKRTWPSWIPPKSIDPKQKAVHPYNKDRKNPLGVARIGLDKFGIYLHGTNNPRSLRRNVSHGCVRHSNKDIMTIYKMVKPGTKVLIVKRFVGTTLTKEYFEA
jgi:lipoprotein-anchoring transpeptidase ErfK/SrfK